jgi:hypothetical protein
MVYMISLTSIAFSQETKQKPNEPAKPHRFMKFQMFCNPQFAIPHKVKQTFDMFKFADEIGLTDNQLIQLRAYYKKYYSEKAEKI